MSTTEINSIIEYLTKNGLTPEDIEDEFRCFNKLQSTGIDDDGNLIIKIGRF